MLVFVPNDYRNNFPLWRFLRRGWDPEHLPYVSAVRAGDGSFRLRPPDPDWHRYRLSRLPDPPAPVTPWRWVSESRALRTSWFLSWLRIKQRKSPLFDPFHECRTRAQSAEWIRRVELMSLRPAWAPLLDDWRPFREGRANAADESKTPPSVHALFAERNGSPFYTEALTFTAFGLDEFKKRT